MKYTDAQLVELLKDSRYQNIGALPSQGHAYPWKDLYIRPLTVNELPLISKSAALNDMTYMIRAMDAVCTQKVDDFTIGDFYFVMMWLRIHSMPKTPLVIDWHCTEQVLRHKETGELVFNTEPYQQPEDVTEYELVDCDTHNTETVHMSNVKILSLPEGDEFEGLPPGFDFPRARHIEGISEALRNPETAMTAPGIQWYAGNTFADRLRAFQTAEDGLEAFDTAMALNERIVHGISEHTTITCRHCRKQDPWIVNIAPHNFFR